MILKIFLSVVAVFAASPAGAQTSTTTFNRVRTFDAEHYSISTKVDQRRRSIEGETIVTLRPLADDFRTLELDSEGLRYASVELLPERTRLRYQVTPGKITIELGRSFRAGEVVIVGLRYNSKPSKGVYLVDPRREDRAIAKDPQVWTHNEPEQAHYWFPSYDFPDDKATSEQYITVDRGQSVIANGELLEVVDDVKTRTFHYKMSQPHSTYLTSFVVGKFDKISDDHNGVPLSFYYYPGHESTARKAFEPTAEMMSVFDEATSIPFPFNKYDQTIVASFLFGGMENVTATTLSDRDVFLVDDSFGKQIVIDLVSHELAHSWFGNMVTCRNWAELWLNEGFATYMEAVYREKRFGKTEYIRKILEDADVYFAEYAKSKRKRGVFNQLARPDDSIFDAITYEKAGVVIHMLRRTLGDETFWRGIRAYLRKYAWKNVETQDLRSVFEEVSGRDLKKFFDQWVYGSKHPILRFRDRYDAATKDYTLSIDQVQPPDDLTPDVFEMNLVVDVPYRGGRVTKILMIDRRSKEFTFPVPEKPGNPIFDPEKDIPLLQIRER